MLDLLITVITSCDSSLAHLSLPPTAQFFIWLFPCFHQTINPTPLPPPTFHLFCQLHCIDTRVLAFFHTDLKSSRLITYTVESFGSLLIAYNTTLSSVLDKHAPIITKLTRHQSPSNPRFMPSLHAFWSTVCHAENLLKCTHSALYCFSFKSVGN